MDFTSDANGSLTIWSITPPKPAEYMSEAIASVSSLYSTATSFIIIFDIIIIERLLLVMSGGRILLLGLQKVKYTFLKYLGDIVYPIGLSIPNQIGMMLIIFFF